jgi:hypothetical protein
MASAAYMFSGMVFMIAGVVLLPVLSLLVPANIALNFLLPFFPLILGIIMFVAGAKKSD